MIEQNTLQKVLHNIEKAMELIKTKGIPKDCIPAVEEKIKNLEESTNELTSLYKNNQ